MYRAAERLYEEAAARTQRLAEQKEALFAEWGHSEGLSRGSARILEDTASTFFQRQEVSTRSVVSDRIHG